MNSECTLNLECTMKDSTWKLKKAIESIPNQGCELITTIREKLVELGWDECEVFKIHLALEEAVMNAIKHGNELDPNKKVSIECKVDGEQFHIEITDEGTGFDRSQVPDPTLEENLLKETGRGLMLIEKYMSDVEYVGDGNRIRMFKKNNSSNGENCSRNSQSSTDCP